METALECTMELKKFLKKLQTILRSEAVFSLFKLRLYNKVRIDDILCCIEGSFPEQYKSLIKNKQARKLQSYQIYLQLSTILKNKFSLNSALYSIKKEQADTLITAFTSKIDSDIRFILNNQGSI